MATADDFVGRFRGIDDASCHCFFHSVFWDFRSNPPDWRPFFPICDLECFNQEIILRGARNVCSLLSRERRERDGPIQSQSPIGVPFLSRSSPVGIESCVAVLARNFLTTELVAGKPNSSLFVLTISSTSYHTLFFLHKYSSKSLAKGILPLDHPF